MFKLRARPASEAESQESALALRGEQLAVVSPDETGKWPFGVRLLLLAGLAAGAWIALLTLPGLLTDLAGTLLDLLFRTLD